MDNTLLEQYQAKTARLNYLLTFLQVFLSQKKEYTLTLELDKEIKKLAQEELGLKEEITSVEIVS